MAITFDDTAQKRLLEALGLRDGEANPETVLLAVEDAVTTPADPAVAAAAGAGVLVDATKYEELKAAAAQGATIAAAAAKREREQKITDAIRQGKLAPANADKWRMLLEQSPEAAMVLASMPVTIPVTEIGHSDPGVEGEVTEPAGWIR